MTTAKINRAIRSLNLEIIHQRGAGYSYFLDIHTHQQIGEMVMVCYLHQLTLSQWFETAAEARNSQETR
jgi:hypothetical protein